MSNIVLKDLSFTYPGTDVAVIDQLNLQIADGEAHALLGASGSGKTTLLNLLSGILVPSHGQILFADKDVSQLPGVSRGIAQVFQFPVLYPSVSVEQNLRLPAANLGFAESEISSRLGFISTQLEVGGLLGKKISDLSLYQKQLVAVAKALMRPDVSVVLLDEPLTAVEPKLKWQLRQALLTVREQLGITMVYVTHDQTEALTFADRVSVVSEQGILQTDSPQNIYETPAHTYVGYFVGSPGMNILRRNPDNPDAEFGFRPEWAELQAAGEMELQGTVVANKAEGSAQGQIFGLTQVQLQSDHKVYVRGPINFEEGEQVGLAVHKRVEFERGWRV